MQRTCKVCGDAYTAKDPRSRYCSDRCRKRQQRNPTVERVAEPVAGGLVAATRRELEAAGRLETVVGQQALTLAIRMDSGEELGSAVASLSKEFRAVMEQALDGVKRAADPLDELRLRRERRTA